LPRPSDFPPPSRLAACCCFGGRAGAGAPETVGERELLAAGGGAARGAGVRGGAVAVARFAGGATLGVSCVRAGGVRIADEGGRLGVLATRGGGGATTDRDGLGVARAAVLLLSGRGGFRGVRWMLRA
jgi:hypothetical protein